MTNPTDIPAPTNVTELIQRLRDMAKEERLEFLYAHGPVHQPVLDALCEAADALERLQADKRRDLMQHADLCAEIEQGKAERDALRATNAALQERCERYEKALKWYAKTAVLVYVAEEQPDKVYAVSKRERFNRVAREALAEDK